MVDLCTLVGTAAMLPLLPSLLHKGHLLCVFACLGRPACVVCCLLCYTPPRSHMYKLRNYTPCIRAPVKNTQAQRVLQN